MEAHITDPCISAPNNPASSLSESTEWIAQAAQDTIWDYTRLKQEYKDFQSTCN